MAVCYPRVDGKIVPEVGVQKLSLCISRGSCCGGTDGVLTSRTAYEFSYQNIGRGSMFSRLSMSLLWSRVAVVVGELRSFINHVRIQDCSSSRTPIASRFSRMRLIEVSYHQLREDLSWAA